MNKVLLDILLIIGGTFFVGARNMIVKWILTIIFKWLRKRLVKTERHLALWMHYQNKAMRKKPKNKVQHEIEKIKNIGNSLKTG